jgi:hypothetical protein
MNILLWRVTPHWAEVWNVILLGLSQQILIPPLQSCPSHSPGHPSISMNIRNLSLQTPF